MSTADEHTSVHCKTCSSRLMPHSDRQKTTGRYWKNCESCRRAQVSKKDEREIRKFYGRAPLRRPPRPTAHYGSNRAENRPPPASLGTFAHRTFKPASSSTKFGFGRKLPTLHTSNQSAHIRENLASINSTTVVDQVANPPTNTALQTECSVCNDKFAKDQVPHLKQCTHEPDVCQGCFGTWLAAQVDTARSDQITCPSDGCKVPIHHSDMERLASAETYAR
jgi:hypothetical protein